MKKFLLLFLALSLSCLAIPPVWNAAEGFGGWRAKENCAVEVKESVLRIEIRKRDPQVLLEGLGLNPRECTALVYTYRANGPIEEGGQLFYARKGEAFSNQHRWNLPVPECDGKWHTVTLGTSAILEGWDWFSQGEIASLRLDPTDSGEGEVEYSDIRFVFDEDAAVSTRPVAPLPKVTPILDAPVWESEQPGFRPLPQPNDVAEGAYFRGKMIFSPSDKQGRGKDVRFHLRREVDLKAAPQLAMLQFTADDWGYCYVNGHCAGRFANWRDTLVVEVTEFLKKGRNVLGMTYVNEDNVGGAICELFVRYPDGSVEYFNSDESFGTSPAGGTPENWNQLSYDASGWTPVRCHDAPPSPPWKSILPYRDFTRQGLQKLQGTELSAKEVTAGETLHLEFTFQGTPPQTPFPAQLNLRHDGDIVWDEKREFQSGEVKELDKERWVFSFDYEAPLYMSTADCTLEILANVFDKPITAAFRVKGLETIPGYETKPSFRVEKTAWGPTFFLNGSPVYPLWGGVQRGNRPDNLPVHNSGAVDINTLYVLYPRTWQKTDLFKTSEYDRQAEAYRRNNKDAYFVVDIQCYPPSGWDRLHPDEMCTDERGKVNYDGGRLNHSFSSEHFVPDCLEYLEKALGYLEHCPYANRIIGYRITGGHTLEWLGWDPNPVTTLDFSPASQKAFGEYLREHYPEISDYSVPTMAEREKLDGEKILWNQRKHLRSVAYADFYSNEVVNCMIPLCKRAKELVGPDKVVGVYYGYTMTLGASGRAQMRAHFALKRVLEEKCVDFMISPHPYALRNIGDIMGDMKPFSSIAAHGVVPVIEEDSRTFRCPPDLGYFQTINEKDTVEVSRRNMADTLCRNYQYYFYNLTAGSEFDFDQAVRDQACLRAVGQHCIEKGVPRAAEVALVASEETIKAMPMLKKSVPNGELRQSYVSNGSVYTTPLTSTVFTGETLELNYVRWARAGAAMDYLLAEDLADNPGEYKLYVFLNCVKYDQAFLEAVDRLRQRECTLLWIYAPGYSFGLDNGVGFMERLTGIQFQESEGMLMPAVTLEDGRLMGTSTTRVAPMFHVTDSAAEARGFYEDGTVGLAVKKTGRATSVFCGPWQFDVPFLTRLLKEAGVHVFSESSDPVDANAALFTLHARFPGHKHITLPRKTDVVDIFDRKMVGTDIQEFDYDAPLHETRFYYYGDDAQELLRKLLAL